MNQYYSLLGLAIFVGGLLTFWQLVEWAHRVKAREDEAAKREASKRS